MAIVFVLLVAAVVFGICYAVDRAFTKAFRSKAQHRSGLAVRANKMYGLFGLILSVLGVLGIVTGLGTNLLLLGGAVIVLILGICLAVYYLTYGIFYDGETFLVCSFGKTDREYAFRNILGQRLYLVQGGNIIVELHMADGSAVSVQSSMDGIYTFLDTAFAGWCLQKGIDPESCDFHDPSRSLWFPTVEEG
ncbi:MAG: hypothetical protein IJA75_09210 [Oscillospiraceae bacterium]|nr:hypothetical protein [Oscillospiraceae bacterium]